MKTITRIGSALKRAALYVPRKIRNRIYRKRNPFIMKPGFLHIKDEVVGPFQTTINPHSKIAQIDRINAEAKGAQEKTIIPLSDSEHVELDQQFFFGTKPKIARADAARSWPTDDGEHFFGK